MTDHYAELWKRRHEVIYRVELSTLYHQKRERFFELLDKNTKGVAVIGGSAALARLGGDEALVWIAALVTVSSTLSLVWGFADRARRHSDFANRFCMLASSILAKGHQDLTEELVCEWEGRARELEASEPAALSVLVRICQAELNASRGVKYELPPWYQRIFAHVLDLPKAAP
jgi:hypothetical protein